MDFFTPLNIKYHMSGKFIANTEEWKHYTRELTDYELMLVTSGTLYIQNQDQKFTVKEGEFLLMPPSKIQEGYKQSKCSFYWLHIYYDEHIKLQEELCIRLPQQAKLVQPERVIVLLKQLQDSDNRYHDQNFNSILAAAIFSEIQLQTNPSIKHQINYSQEHLLDEVKEYIKWHLHENLRICDIASYFGYNEKYLTTLFTKHHGQPLKQYILQSKMEHAKIQLTDTTKQIAQIAYNLGYEDSHNFSTSFKKITGLYPRDYREHYGKEEINRE